MFSRAAFLLLAAALVSCNHMSGPVQDRLDDCQKAKCPGSYEYFTKMTAADSGLVVQQWLTNMTYIFNDVPQVFPEVQKHLDCVCRECSALIEPIWQPIGRQACGRLGYTLPCQDELDACLAAGNSMETCYPDNGIFGYKKGWDLSNPEECQSLCRNEAGENKPPCNPNDPLIKLQECLATSRTTAGNQDISITVPCDRTANDKGTCEGVAATQCEADHSQCGEYIGYCGTGDEWMKKNCKATCKNSKPKDLCTVWKSENHCNTGNSYMEQNCAATCAPKPALTAREQGDQFIHDFLSAVAEGFKTNDMSKHYAQFANEVEWDWSGGVKGKGTLEEYKAVLESSWKPITGDFMFRNAKGAFDPDRRMLVMTADLDLNINARGAAADCWNNGGFNNPASWLLKMDENLKVTYFGGTWNPDDNAKCIEKALKALGVTPPASPAPFEQDMAAVANTWIKGFIKTLAAGFATGNFDANLEYFADKVNWEWSGGVTGSGSREDYKNVLLGSWGAVVSQLAISDLQVAFDPYTGKLDTVFNLFLNINARSSDPKDNCFLVGDNGFVSWNFVVDANQKVTDFKGVWDPAETADCLTKAAALLSQN